jgi:hypothetical protein
MSQRISCRLSCNPATHCNRGCVYVTESKCTPTKTRISCSKATSTSHHTHHSYKHLHWWKRNLYDMVVELEFFLRPTVSRPVSLGIGPPFGTLDQILSCSSFFWQLRRCAVNASSLTRKRVCNLLLNCFWVLPEQSHVSRSPTELMAISYCLIWDSPNLEGQVPVFISPRNRVAQIYPRALGSLSVASYDSRGLRWKYSNPPPHGVYGGD